MAGKNKTEATQVRAEYLGLRPAIGSRDNLTKDPYFQPVQVESSKVPARAPDGWLATVGKTRPFRKPCDNSGNKVCHRVYGGDANNVSGSPCGGVAAQLDNGRATRQSAHSPILPEPPGEDGLPVDKPRLSGLVRLIGLEPRNPYILREYPARHLKRFLEMYNVHNIKPVAFNICDQAVHIATDGKEYYIVFLDLESAVVPVGDS
ncbi:hypothetical protein TWF679_005292 [Orbilia oligospora]|uniref:Uncharacterized protein n=1 Tax=Orbilia oligospora TaxID=2813651 RepID=A0A8H8VCE2_ORBOL|nr:hypothetical protein TWF679_005292 [Orbilia oligospora]